MLPCTRARVRQHLREARVRHHQDASPGHQLPALPALLSVGEITHLREQVEPVSLFHCLFIPRILTLL